MRSVIWRLTSNKPLKTTNAVKIPSVATIVAVATIVNLTAKEKKESNYVTAKENKV